MTNFVKIKQYIESEDNPQWIDAYIDLNKFVSITAINSCYPDKRFLQIGIEKIMISVEDAEKIWYLLNAGKGASPLKGIH